MSLILITLLASLTQVYTLFDEPVGLKEYTASYELWNKNKPDSGIRDGELQYSFLQSSYRLQMRQYSELYTFDQPKNFLKRSRRGVWCGRTRNCLEAANITSVATQEADGNYSITYSFTQPVGCNIAAFVLNRLPQCISPAQISVTSLCNTVGHPLNASLYCRRSEGLRYPNGGIGFNLCPGIVTHLYTVKMNGAVPGDGLLNFYSIKRIGRFEYADCGTVKTTVFVCPAEEPQLKFITAQNCNSTCEIGQPVDGGFPALWNSSIVFTKTVNGTASTCSKYSRKVGSMNPVVTLLYNESSGVPCSAEFSDGRNFTFSRFVATNFSEDKFKKPSSCNCSSPIDIGVVVHPGCSFNDYEDLRETAWNLLSAFDISDRRCRMSIWRSHQIKVARRLLRLVDGISRQNVFSGLYTKINVCCNKYRGRDDDSCCDDNSLADTIGDAADDIYNTSLTRNYATTKAIVVFVSNLTDSAISTKLAELKIKYPDLVVYFVSLLFDTQVGNPDLGNSGNYQILTRSDWVYWRRIPLQLIGSVCSQVKNPCGASCCGECVCKQCIPADRCPPRVTPPTPCSGNVMISNGCCMPSDVSCDKTQADIDNCLTRFCNSTSQLCETASTCPPSDTNYSYTCRDGACAAIATDALRTAVALKQDELDSRYASTIIKECQTAILGANGEIQVVTSKVCRTSLESCDFARSYCNSSTTCVHEWLVPEPNTCVDYKCPNVVDTETNEFPARLRCAETPQICFKLCDYGTQNTSLNYATINPNINFVDGSFQNGIFVPKQPAPVCDVQRGGVCATQPANCSLDQEFNPSTGKCVAKNLNTYCPDKRNESLVASSLLNGMCIYLPAICPLQDCTKTSFPGPITTRFLGPASYDCILPNGTSIGPGYALSDAFIRQCKAVNRDCDKTAFQRSDYSCKFPPTQCIIGGPEGTLVEVTPIFPFPGQNTDSFYCQEVVQTYNRNNTCLSQSNFACLANGRCAFTPSLTVSVDQACTQTVLVPNLTARTCSPVTTDRVCSTPNKCYEYKCDPKFGCQAFEKCNTTKCARFTCVNPNTGECAKIGDVIPLELRSPCFNLTSCNDETGAWQYLNACDDGKSDTEDVCTPVGNTANFVCDHYCKNDLSADLCEIKVYNPITQTCVSVTNPKASCIASNGQSIISLILNEKAVSVSLKCKLGDKCQEGLLVNNSCVFTPTDCTDNDPCTIDRCEPTVGCIHEQNSCNSTENPSIDSCAVYTCQSEYDSVNKNYTAKCVMTPVECASSVKIEVIVVVALLTVGAVVGIVIAVLVVGAASAGTAYYVKLNVAPDEEPETNWNDAYDNKEAPRRGGANPVHKRH